MATMSKLTFSILSDKTSASADSFSLIVVSLQLQPVLSLAEKFGLASATEAAERLSTFFRSLGADVVTDLRVAEDISLIELRKEFLERVREKKKLPLLTSSCPGLSTIRSGTGIHAWQWQSHTTASNTDF